MGRRRTRKSSTYATAKKAVRNELAKMVEVKKFYFASNASVDLDGITLGPLLGISVGTNDDERLGNQINLLSMSARMNLQSGGNNTNTIRVMLLQVYSPANSLGTVYTVPDLFNPIQYSSVGAINANVNRKIVQRVMVDKTIQLNPYNSLDTVFHYRKFYKSFGKIGKRIQYEEGEAGGNNLVTKGHFLWVWVSNNPPGVTPPRINYCAETRYTDC